MNAFGSSKYEFIISELFYTFKQTNEMGPQSLCGFRDWIAVGLEGEVLFSDETFEEPNTCFGVYSR